MESKWISWTFECQFSRVLLSPPVQPATQSAFSCMNCVSGAAAAWSLCNKSFVRFVSLLIFNFLLLPKKKNLKPLSAVSRALKEFINGPNWIHHNSCWLAFLSLAYARCQQARVSLELCVCALPLTLLFPLQIANSRNSLPKKKEPSR